MKTQSNYQELANERIASQNPEDSLHLRIILFKISLFLIISIPTLSTTYLRYLGLPWKTLLAFSIFISALTRINYSLRNLTFFMPFIVSITLSLILNIFNIHTGGINSAIAIAISFLPFIMRSLPIRKQELNSIGFIFVSLLLAATLLFYLLKNTFIDFLPKQTSPFSIFLNANSAGISYFFALIIINITAENRLIKKIYSITLFALIINTQNRSSLFAVLFIFAIRFFLWMKQREKKITIINLYLLLLISISSLFLVNQIFPSIDLLILKVNRFSSTNRTLIWESVFADTLSNYNYIFFGSGPATLSYSLINNEIIRFSDGKVGLSTHNSYLNLFATLGIFGFISAIPIIYFLFKELRYKRTILISILFISFFETQLFSGLSLLWILLIFLFYDSKLAK